MPGVLVGDHVGAQCSSELAASSMVVKCRHRCRGSGGTYQMVRIGIPALMT